MNQSSILKLQKFFNWKTALIAVGVFLLMQLFLASYVLPHVKLIQPDAVKNNMLVMIDLQPFMTPQAQYKILNLYRPNVVGYIYLMYVVDFVLPLAITFLFLSLIGMILKRLDKLEKLPLLLFMPFLSLFFDFMENILAVFMIVQNPTHVYYILAHIEGVVTGVKLLAYSTTVLLLICLTLLTFFRYVRNKISLFHFK